MFTITEKDILDYEFIFQKMKNEPSGLVSVELHDKSLIKMPIRRALISCHLARIALINGLPLKKEYLLIHQKKINLKAINKIYNIIDQDLLKINPKRSIEKLCRDLFINNDRLSNLSKEYCCEYMESFGLLELIELTEQPAVKNITDNASLDLSLGTKFIEKEISNSAIKLQKILNKGEDELDYNPLYHQLDYINMNQLIQFVLTYGPRSDVDDNVMQHVIKGNTLDGFQDIRDYIIESLSAKKAKRFNKDVIKTAQYLARKIMLSCLEITSFASDVDDCGTEVTLNRLITDNNKNEYIGAYINHDGDRNYMLTKENINKFVGTYVKKYSPTTCKVKNGSCKHCLGNVANYILSGKHLGFLAATIVVSDSTQLVLSTKHLIRTISIIYTLINHLKQFFYLKDLPTPSLSIEEIEDLKDSYIDYDITDDGIVLITESLESHLSNEEINDYYNEDVGNDVGLCFHKSYETQFNTGDIKMSIPLDSFKGSLTDIFLNPPIKSFTKVDSISLIGNNNRSIKIDINHTGDYDIYFSKYTIDFIRNKMEKGESEITNKNLIIPLNGYNTDNHFVISKTINTDITTLIKRIEKFLRTDIVNHTSIDQALNEFSDILFTQIKTPMVYIEILLKSYLGVSPDNVELPEVIDPNNVHFHKMLNVVSRTPAGRSAFEELPKYFDDPDTFLSDSRSSTFDPLFGDVT
jgi:hypothetical protein